MKINYSIEKCVLGLLLAASSEKGICAILLADNSQQLLNELQSKFPKADLVQDRHEKISGEIIDLINNPAQATSLKLDQQGTQFQQRVWNQLKKIPPGKTASYAEIAEKIGLPDAARAVANACAANRHAVLIPCHRVVRSDGKISGYRWGIQRKCELLRREASL